MLGGLDLIFPALDAQPTVAIAGARAPHAAPLPRSAGGLWRAALVQLRSWIERWEPSKYW